MARANSTGQMELSIRENSNLMRLLAKESISGLMSQPMMARFRMASDMVRALILTSKRASNIKESGSMECVMEKVPSPTKTAQSMKANGKEE